MNKRWMIILCKFSIFSLVGFLLLTIVRFFSFTPLQLMNVWGKESGSFLRRCRWTWHTDESEELHKLGILRSRSGKRVWVQVTARKFNFSVPTFPFHLPCGWQKFSIEFFCCLEIFFWFFFSPLICVSRRTRISVFAQRNALKKSSVVLCQLFLILNSECVVSQIFASADKEMFYLRNAKHDTFTPKTLFDTLLEGWLGRREKRSALPCAVVKFNSPSYMLMMFAGNLRACVKSVIKYLTHFPGGDYRHFCALRVRW